MKNKDQEPTAIEKFQNELTRRAEWLKTYFGDASVESMKQILEGHISVQQEQAQAELHDLRQEEEDSFQDYCRQFGIKSRRSGRFGERMTLKGRKFLKNLLEPEEHMQADHHNNVVELQRALSGSDDDTKPLRPIQTGWSLKGGEQGEVSDEESRQQENPNENPSQQDESWSLMSGRKPLNRRDPPRFVQDMIDRRYPRNS